MCGGVTVAVAKVLPAAHRNLGRQPIVFFVRSERAHKKLAQSIRRVKMNTSVVTFQTIGAETKGSPGRPINDQDFKALFGVRPEICTAMWQLMEIPSKTGIPPKHLLWSLLVMTVHAKEMALCVMTQMTPKTHQKWVWKLLPRMAGTCA